MQNFKLKTLVAALAMTGLATACNDRAERDDAYVPPEPSAVERSTTATGTTDPSALNSQNRYSSNSGTTDGSLSADDSSRNTLNATGTGATGQSGSMGSSLAANVDHEETVHFNGTALTDDSEEKLQDLVESLDKSKPVAIIVAMQDNAAGSTSGANSNSLSGSTQGGMSGSQTGSSSQAGINSSQAGSQSGQTGSQAGTASSSTAQIDTQSADSAGMLSQRVDQVRQFMQEQGVQVVQWRFEGTAQQPSIEQQGLTQDQQTQMQQEDLQQIRLVMSTSNTGAVSAIEE